MNGVSRRRFLTTTGAGWALTALAPYIADAKTERPPNVVIIMADDMGWQDIGCYGAPYIETPNIDRMAAEGVKFTDFHTAMPYCAPSRYSLLTGCYPARLSFDDNPFPNTTFGISDNETTIAQMLKQRGYATAIYGKWHLGHQPQFLPTRHGFDEYYGLPYSNDMWPFHPEQEKFDFPPLPLMENETILEYNPDQTRLTTDYTTRAVSFIERNVGRPFFLYVPHSMPHVPIYVSDKFKDTSKRGLYGDVVSEIDWSVGQILDTLKRNGLDDNTLVIFTSDNGPWLSYGEHAGSAGLFREGKATSFEGGHRVPCIVRWSGKIPAGRACTDPAMTLDFMPTIAGITGGTLPDHPIDGGDIMPLMTDQDGAKSPHEIMYLYQGPQLQAVREGRWKLHVRHPYQSLGGRRGGAEGQPAPVDTVWTTGGLYDLYTDPGEHYDRSAEFPEIVERLTKLGEAFKAKMARESRPAGHAEL